MERIVRLKILVTLPIVLVLGLFTGTAFAGTATPNIGLYKPAQGESGTSWSTAMNNNLDIIDTYVGLVLTEGTAAVTHTAAEWTSLNPILSLGVLGYESDTRKLKIGNGITEWTSLLYLADEGGGGSWDGTIEDIVGSSDAEFINYGTQLHLVDAGTTLQANDAWTVDGSGNPVAPNWWDPTIHQSIYFNRLWYLGEMRGYGWAYIKKDNYSPLLVGGTRQYAAFTVWNHEDPSINTALLGAPGIQGAYIEAQNYGTGSGAIITGIQGMASEARQSEVLGTDGNSYACILDHTAAAGNRPVTGASYDTYWCKSGESGCAGGYGNEAWVLGTAYKASGYGVSALYGIVGSAWAYGDPSIMIGSIGEAIYSGSSWGSGNIAEGFSSRVIVCDDAGASQAGCVGSPQTEGYVYAYYAPAIIGGGSKFSFFGSDRMAVQRSTVPEQDWFDSSINATWTLAIGANQVTPTVYAEINNTGSANGAFVGHGMAYLGIAKDTAIGQMDLIGFEGRTNGYGTAFQYIGALGYGWWEDADPTHGAGPTLLIGVLGRAQGYQHDGSTPSTLPVMAAAFYADPVVGGLAKYSFVANDPIRINTGGGAFVSMQASAPVAAANCGSGAGVDGCFAFTVNGTTVYVPYYQP